MKIKNLNKIEVVDNIFLRYNKVILIVEASLKEMSLLYKGKALADIETKKKEAKSLYRKIMDNIDSNSSPFEKNELRTLDHILFIVNKDIDDSLNPYLVIDDVIEVWSKENQRLIEINNSVIYDIVDSVNN